MIQAPCVEGQHVFSGEQRPCCRRGSPTKSLGEVGKSYGVSGSEFVSVVGFILESL